MTIKNKRTTMMTLKVKISTAISAGLLFLATPPNTVWAQTYEMTSGLESPPLPVSVAMDGLPLDLSYRLRQGFGPYNVFDTHDRNVYYHLHWGEFIPHNIVRRDGPIKTLPYKLNQRVGKVKTTSPLGELELDALISDPRSRIQGFVVVHKGALEYETYPGMRDTDNHIWMSSSKSVVSLLVGLLEADGRIDVSQSVDAYLTELKGTNWEGIRIIDILDMASGLDIIENDENMQDETHWFHKWFRIMLGDSSFGTLTAKETIFSAKNLHKPGEIFEYSSMNTQILGLLVERVAGQRLADFLSERVWSKIGAEGDALLGLDPSGGPSIFGYISSRLRDKARYGLLYTPSWKRVADERIIPLSLIEKTQKDCRPKLYERAYDAAKKAGTASYFSDDTEIRCNSRQWDAVYTDGDMFKGGLHGQGIYVSPTRDLVIAYYSTSPFDWLDTARAIAEIY